MLGSNCASGFKIVNIQSKKIMINIKRLFDSIPGELKSSITLHQFRVIVDRYNSLEKKDLERESEQKELEEQKSALLCAAEHVRKLSEKCDARVGVDHIRPEPLTYMPLFVGSLKAEEKDRNTEDLPKTPCGGSMLGAENYVESNYAEAEFNALRLTTDYQHLLKEAAPNQPYTRSCPRCHSRNTVLRPPSKLCVGNYYKCNACGRGFSCTGSAYEASMSRLGAAQQTSEAAAPSPTKQTSEGVPSPLDNSLYTEPCIDWYIKVCRYWIAQSLSLSDLSQKDSKSSNSHCVTETSRRGPRPNILFKYNL